MAIVNNVEVQTQTLDNGRLVVVGTMGELRTQAKSTAESTLEDLFLQLTGGNAIADIANVLT